MLYHALVVFDNINGQCTQNFFKVFEDNHVNVVLVAANCTHNLQPLELSVIKLATSVYREKNIPMIALQI